MPISLTAVEWLWHIGSKRKISQLDLTQTENGRQILNQDDGCFSTYCG